jgi:hypothetical protein
VRTPAGLSRAVLPAPLEVVTVSMRHTRIALACSSSDPAAARSSMDEKEVPPLPAPLGLLGAVVQSPAPS